MNRAIALTCGIAALTTALAAAAPVHATGVTAGTLIQNTASATFDNAAGTTTVQSNTVTVRVDELLDVAVASLAGGTTTLTASTVAIPFRVTNTGNGDEAFTIAVSPAVAGNQFDATLQAVAVDANGNGTYEAGVDTLLGAAGATAPLAADAAITVFALVALMRGLLLIQADGSRFYSQVRFQYEVCQGCVRHHHGRWSAQPHGCCAGSDATRQGPAG